jgi:hypothetical protein
MYLMTNTNTTNLADGIDVISFGDPDLVWVKRCDVPGAQAGVYLGRALSAWAGDRRLKCQLIGGDFVMSGGLYGEHRLSANVTSMDRLCAHWIGYVSNNRSAS